MKKLLNILLLTVSLWVIGFAQDGYSHYTRENALYKKYDSLVSKYLYTDPQKALFLAQQGFEKASNKSNNIIKARFYQLLQTVYDVIGDPFNAISAGYQALLIYDLYEVKDLFHQGVLRLAKSYFNAQFSDKFFIKLLDKTIDYYDKLDDRINYQKAKIYKRYFKVISSISPQTPELDFIDPKDSPVSDYIEINTILAEYYKKLKQYRKAIAIYKRLGSYLTDSDNFAIAINNLQLAKVYIATNNLKAVDKLLQLPQNYFSKHKNIVYLAQTYYLKMLAAYKTLDSAKAIMMGQRVLQLSQRYGLISLSSKVYFILSEIYIRGGKNDLAFYSYSNFVSLRDSIYNIYKLYQISTNQLKLSSLEKERENYLLRKAKEYEELKNRQQKLVILIFGLLAVILAIILIFLYYIYRANLKYSERLKRFAQISQEGIIIFENKILEFNDKILKLTGYTEEEFHNIKLEHLFSEQVIDHIHRSDTTLFLETEVRRKDGSTFIAEVLVKPFPYSKFKKAKVISIHDVSQFRKAQRELLESQMKFKTLIDISPDSIIVTDEKGQITYISKAALRLFGSESVYMFLQKDLCQMVEPEYHKALEHTINNLKAKDEPQELDFKMHRNGKDIYIECRCVGVRNTKGQITGLLFILRDVTQRYLYQEAIRRSEEKFKGLFNKAIDGIIIIDNTGKIVDANPAASKILGMPLDQIINQSFIQLLPPTLRKNFSLKDILKSDKKFETVLVRNPEQLIYVQISVSALSSDDEKQLYLFILRDITELRMNQERLKKFADKLQASNTAKIKLFSIISHDLRGPIGNLKSMLELILESPESFDTDELKDILLALKDTSVSTYELLENLLYWAKTQLDQIEYNPQDFPLNTVVDSTIKIFKESARRKEITIENYITRPDIIVRADPDMVKTILRNLISNAIKFTPRGGRISLRYYADDQMVIVAVKDTGVGIPQERLTEIFDPNKFVSTRGTENEKGTGIGLDIVREFVRKNKGKLWVESWPGKGSTFYFSLPKP